MPRFTSTTSLLAVGVLTGLAWTATAPRLAAEGGSAPDFSSNDVAWVLASTDYIPIPDGPTPTRNDPAHPFVPNGTGAQPTFRVADLANPNIKPWAKQILKRENDKVLAGKIGYTARSSCMPAGVPDFWAYAVFESMHFLQTRKEVTIIFSGDAQVRHVYLDVPHSANLAPSWYGESIGHYEGDTLVVDTIGMNDKTYLDGFRTPHTEKLHVVERFRTIDDGKTLQVAFRIEDPDTFYAPWSALINFRRVQRPMHEEACAENNTPLFDYHIPVANKPDF
jgi:hypothetical protein